MQQKAQPMQPLSVSDYDPETDPVLAPLRSHRSSGAGKRAALAVAIVALVAAGGWFAYDAYRTPTREAARAQPEPPAPLPVISPLQKAEAWCVENLASTEFAALPVIEGEDGSFFVVYSARAGDSIGSVVKRYRASVGSGAPLEILELAKRQHAGQYGGRGLWVADEIRLPVPMEAGEWNE